MEWYIIVLLALAGAGLFYLFAGCIACLVLGFIFKHPVGRLGRPTYDQMRVICRDFDFSVYDRMEKEEFIVHNRGAELKCEFIPVPDPGKGRAKCVISAHGFGLNLIFSARYAPMFHALGYSVVVYDARGLGKSTGSSSLGYLEKYDMAAIADWVRERLGKDTVIGVHGESLGAVTALETLGVDPDIAFAIPDSCVTAADRAFSGVIHLPSFPFFSFLNLLSKLFYKIDMREVRPLDRAAAAEVPILFICGTNDKVTPHAQSEELFAAAKHPLSRLELFEGAWHTGSYAHGKERYEQAVGDFVRTVEEALPQQTQQEEKASV